MSFIQSTQNMFARLGSVANHPFFNWVGLLFVVKMLFTQLPTIYEGFLLYVWSHFAPKRDFIKDYGKWAVITGGSDGIGKCLAFELAAKGMNIFILSNAENDLISVCQEIETKYGVESKWHCVDFSDLSFPDRVEPHLNDLNDIGILVNNVGIINEGFKTVPNQSKESIMKIICVNTMPTALMSRIVVTRMIQQRKGLIVNVGSKTANYAIPRTTVYGGTKAFIHKFSECFVQEVDWCGVQVSCVEPGFVSSGLLTRDPNSRAFADSFPSLVTPTPEAFAENVVRILNVKAPLFFSGHWYHALEGYFTGQFAAKLFVKIFLNPKKP